MKKTKFQCLPNLSEFFDYEIKLTLTNLVQGLLFGFSEYIISYGLHNYYQFGPNVVATHPFNPSLQNFLKKVIEINQPLSPADPDLTSLSNQFSKKLGSFAEKIRPSKTLSLISNTLAIVMRVKSDFTFSTFGSPNETKPTLFLYKKENSFFLLYPKSYENVYSNFYFQIREKEVFHCGHEIPLPYSKNSLNSLYDRGRKCKKCQSEAYEEEIRFVKDYLARAKLCPLCKDQVMVICGVCFKLNCGKCSPDVCQNCFLNNYMPNGAIVESGLVLAINNVVAYQNPGVINNPPYLQNANPPSKPVAGHNLNPKIHPSSNNQDLAPKINNPDSKKILNSDSSNPDILFDFSPDPNKAFDFTSLFSFLTNCKSNFNEQDLENKMLQDFNKNPLKSEILGKCQRFHKPSHASYAQKLSFLFSNDQSFNQVMKNFIVNPSNEKGDLITLCFFFDTSITILKNSTCLTLGKFEINEYPNVLKYNFDYKQLDLIGLKQKEMIKINTKQNFVRCCGCEFELPNLSKTCFELLEKILNFPCETHKLGMNRIEQELAKGFYLKNHDSCVICSNINVDTKQCSKCKAIYCAKGCKYTKEGKKELIKKCLFCKKSFPEGPKKDKIVLTTPTLEEMINRRCRHNNSQEKGPLKFCFICGIIKIENTNIKSCKICGLFPALKKKKCKICLKK